MLTPAGNKQKVVGIFQPYESGKLPRLYLDDKLMKLNWRPLALDGQTLLDFIVLVSHNPPVGRKRRGIINRTTAGRQRRC